MNFTDPFHETCDVEMLAILHAQPSHLLRKGAVHAPSCMDQRPCFSVANNKDQL